MRVGARLHRGLAAVVLSAVVAASAAGAGTTGDIDTVAGTGTAGYSGDGGPAVAADIDLPRGIAVRADGSYLVVDAFRHVVRSIDAGGVITTVAGTGVAGYSGDGGTATAAQLDLPHTVSLMPDGGFIIADTLNNRVRYVSPAGTITTIAGTGVRGSSGDGGPATQARLYHPRSALALPDGSFLLGDTNNPRIRRVAVDGTITTVAGTGAAGDTGDGGAAVNARLNAPFAAAPAPDGGFFIADTSNHKVRRVSAGGIITTVAGTGVAGFSGDGGPATQAQLNSPHSVLPLPDGGFLLPDTANHRVRRVGADGAITTIAGTGAADYGGDGGPAVEAQLNGPRWLALTPLGDLLMADAFNHRVRRVLGVASPVCESAWQAAVDGSWLDEAAWTPAGVPDATRTVCLTAAGAPHTVTLTGAGSAKTLAVGAAATLEVAGSSAGGDAALSVAAAGSSVTNSGTIRLTSVGGASAARFSASSGRIVNVGTLRFAAGAGGARQITGDVTNAGAVDVEASASVSGAVETAGTVDVAAGATLEITSALTQTAGTTHVDGSIAAAGVALNGGVLSGSGAVGGPLTNRAAIEPGTSTGILAVSGSYTQTAQGTLRVEVNGATAGTGYDRLAVTGTAALGGTLDIDAAPGLNVGDTFLVVTAATRTGKFKTIRGRDLGGGLAIDVVYRSTGVELRVVRSTDLKVTKTDSPDPVAVGQPLTYSITVENVGVNTATQVKVTDVLPASVSFVSASAGCAGNPKVVCSIGSLAASQSATVTIVVTPNQAGTTKNTATVKSSIRDLVTANNKATAATTVVAS